MVGGKYRDILRDPRRSLVVRFEQQREKSVPQNLPVLVKHVAFAFAGSLTTQTPENARLPMTSLTDSLKRFVVL